MLASASAIPAADASEVSAAAAAMDSPHAYTQDGGGSARGTNRGEAAPRLVGAAPHFGACFRCGWCGVGASCERICARGKDRRQRRRPEVGRKEADGAQFCLGAPPRGVRGFWLLEVSSTVGSAARGARCPTCHSSGLASLTCGARIGRAPWWDRGVGPSSGAERSVWWVFPALGEAWGRPTAAGSRGKLHQRGGRGARVTRLLSLAVSHAT